MAESERCGFCFQQDMVEPKKMSCGHVYCLKCLELHTENPDGVDCAYKYCQGFCANGQLKELPDHMEAETVAPEQKNSKPSDLLCDCNGCEGEKAMKYCVDCGTKLCLFHHKHHPAYFKEKHHIICISKYEASPESFPTTECEYHGGKLHFACEHCQKLLCSTCYTLERTCKGEVKNHSLKELQRFRAELENDYEWLIYSATENLTKICKEEKKTWTYHDEIQVKYDEMIKEVEERTQQQIRDLHQQADKVKSEINDEKEKITQKTVEKLSDLAMRREELEVYRLDATRLLEDAHISEKLRQRETITEKIETVTSKELGRRDIWCDKTVLHTGLAKLSVSLLDVPESLEFLSSVSNESRCYTLEYRRDTEDLLLGCASGLQLKDKDGEISIRSTGIDYVCPVEQRGKVYLLYEMREHERGEYVPVEVCECDIDSEDFEELKTLFTFEGNSAILHHLAVSDNYMAVRFYNSQIKLYDRKADSLVTVSVPGLTGIDRLLFLSDGSLLVLGDDQTCTDSDHEEEKDSIDSDDDTNHAEGDGIADSDDDANNSNQAVVENEASEFCYYAKLAKFRFDDKTNLVELWSCHLSVSGGIAVGEGGLIYVGGNQRSISLLSPSGALLRVITHENLPTSISDISVRGNDLAVVAFAAGGVGGIPVGLFKIK